MSSSVVDASGFAYVVGIDVGSQRCDFCVLKPDKSQALKSRAFANARAGFELLQNHLRQLGGPPADILIGLEATSRDAGDPPSLSGDPGLPGVLAASSPNPPVCAATGLAGENRPHRCGHDCARAPEW